MPQTPPKRRLKLAPALVLLLVLAASCTHYVHPPGAPREGSHEVVSSVKFVGASSIKIDELLSGLALLPPQGRVSVEHTYFDPLSHRLDVKRIVAFYREHGFLSAKVVKAEVIKQGHKKRRLVYYLEEGSLTRVASLTAEATEGSELDAATLAKLPTLQAGSPLIYEDYEEGKNEILRHLVTNGYAFAHVTGKIEVLPDKASADVHYRVVPGPLAQFGALRIEGNNRIPTDIIMSRIPFREGDAFSWQLLEKTRTELYGMGVFASVEFDAERTENPLTPLTLRVKEAARQELKLGAGAGIDQVNYEVRGRASYRIASFLRPLGQLKLEIIPRVNYLIEPTEDAKPELGYEASAGYDLQNLLESEIDFNSKFTYSVNNFTGYSIRGPRVSLGLERPFLNHRLLISLSWRFRSLDFLEVNSALSDEDKASVGLVLPYRLGTLVQSVSYDRRDNPREPTRGYYLSLEAEESTDYLGSQFEYLRASPEARAYYPLNSDTVLAGRFRLASTLLTGDVLPITQRYFAGGVSSQRGFGQRRLSPVLGTGDGVPVGGEALVETSVEIRRSLFETGIGLLGLVAFVDGAEVTNKYEDLFKKGLHWATGLGIRLHTIFGTMSIDAGYRLNRRGTGEPAPKDNWSISFNIGEAF